MDKDYPTEKVEEKDFHDSDPYSSSIGDKDLEPASIHANDDEEDSPIEEVRSVVPK